MISLRASYVLLVLTSVLVTLALASYDPIMLMLAVASHFIAGQIVGQAAVAQPEASGS